MDTTNVSTQLRAGFFMLLGLFCIGALVIYFGRFGETVKKCYTITVEYRNASGLLKGADVMLAGAKIGEVASAPTVLPNMRGVAVPLKINESVLIPEGSVFSIGSSGLLGDHFVTVTLGESSADAKPIPPGTVITNGLSESNIAELQRQIHDEILPKLDEALDNIGVVTGRLKKDVLTPDAVRNLQVTMANFRTASDALAASSGGFKGMVEQASSLLKNGNAAIVDLKAFSSNLRQSGILFYRDSGVPPTGPGKRAP
jgi:phospholipid/cholesterol/gamma-HCH transport system substrate-binding protein